MKYRSTRGEVPEIGFLDTVLAGLADDGGLYVPNKLPKFSPAEVAELSKLPYAELAIKVFRPFIARQEVSDSDLRRLVMASYDGGPNGQWRDPEITPVKQVGKLNVLELFHGPTLAFKDVALQMLGNLFEFALAKKGGRLRILGATSGDTGSAAIYGVRGKKRIDCVILYPDGRTSKIQEMQMCTVEDSNIHCLAVDGTFDDCQNTVKAIFTSELKKDLSLGAVNSINWARIMAQITYYFYAAFKVQAGQPKGKQSQPVNVCVPTGNFGDILAGYYAKMMGAPIGKLVIASNSNDILPRFFKTGTYKLEEVAATMSPSMDIGISSNFERVLYDVFGQDPARVRDVFSQFKATKEFSVTPEELEKARANFCAERVSEAECVSTIVRIQHNYEYFLCPHSAVGFAAALRHLDMPGPMVTLATAHWGKFAEAVEANTSDASVLNELKTNMPEQLACLRGRPLRRTMIGTNVRDEVEEFITTKFRSGPLLTSGRAVVGAAVVAIAVALYMRSRK